ncbi:hypothetical protein [Dietzia timorensis]|uniref:Uncharacterized protein n=1 Tax=Dietzia timorensis TaxID=499555 RepID=A0A173LHL2_9ACTN|nr:hypothetical protein [Dietzia timorensis]ANI91373.1 Hypothetical protein BJL86_0570 [Dietzia timorensis]
MTAAVWVALAVGIASAVINTVSVWFVFRTSRLAQFRENSDRAWRRATWMVQLLESPDADVADGGLTVLSVLGEEYAHGPRHDVDQEDRMLVGALLNNLLSKWALEFSHPPEEA